jgi:hypothetical protein
MKKVGVDDACFPLSNISTYVFEKSVTPYFWEDATIPQIVVF